MKNLITYCFILTHFLCYSQGFEEYKATYKGDKLFLKNIFNSNAKKCIDSIKINNQDVKLSENSLIYVLDPGEYEVKIGQNFIIQLFYQNDCIPRFFNFPLTHKKTPILENAYIDSARNIIWDSQNESQNTTYLIQHYKWNRWVTIKEINVQIKKGANQYSFTPNYHSGINKFKIKQLDSVQIKSISKILIYDTPKVCKPIKMFNSQNNIIEFSDSTHYELYDSEGVKLNRGFRKEIDIRNLKKGIYFLNYDNITGEIIKIK